MPSKQEAGQQNLARFEAWIAERDARGDWSEYRRDGQIVRKAIADACGFGRSALIQNPAIANLLKATEDRLRQENGTSVGVLARLEAFLDPCLADDDGRSRLPIRDGGIDMEAIARVIGLTEGGWFLANDPACRSVLNATAATLGLPVIEGRGARNEADSVVKAKLGRARAEASDYAKALAEREAVIQRQRLHIASLEERLRIRDETGMIIRTEPIR
jgi:hypothetical protein